MHQEDHKITCTSTISPLSVHLLNTKTPLLKQQMQHDRSTTKCSLIGHLYTHLNNERLINNGNVQSSPKYISTNIMVLLIANVIVKSCKWTMHICLISRNTNKLSCCKDCFLPIKHKCNETMKTDFCIDKFIYTLQQPKQDHAFDVLTVYNALNGMENINFNI